MDKARRITRTEALRDKNRERNERVPFVVMYHPKLPNIGQILRDLHPMMQSPERCHRAVSNVPMLAFRRPRSLADYLVRARMKEEPRAEGEKWGRNKCGTRRCEVCNSSNAVYLVTCKTCGLQYAGSTKTKFRMRVTRMISFGFQIDLRDLDKIVELPINARAYHSSLVRTLTSCVSSLPFLSRKKSR